MPQNGRVLIIAGSDPSGGAGIQADIKAVTMMGAYAASAITALTVQNTLGVTDVLPIDPDFVKAQIKSVLSDIGADCLKTGMLHDAGLINAVTISLADEAYKGQLVVDPVMVATSGDRLLKAEAVEAMKAELLPRATVVTPNIPEAEVLADMKIGGVDDMRKAAEKILELGARSVCMKGGHLKVDKLTDLLVTADGDEYLAEAEKIDTRHTHGTGCTFASVMAAELSKGEAVEDAFFAAHSFVYDAIKMAPQLGAGHGPLGHAYVRS
ncbi:bifunctional hydroxymethylpyrimidine kinase/phosphomethylpyrimidine kinase [Kordiimonas sp. SCSIO 12603]|uniref:bifunctional hydroxymethylpyrimidine kinase/phosphomethylpyrimidine kinase n=1 Tax=Kordiimonas sp. SCSIO 12603 TaxID=2829596 RepID=UPI0021068446|nr:bifunctional hydroxymethylpyrimidine kinase/phosphomethylpyrimidine kinase [Kordiimonas sp. SCSIO 12603]UTW57978.1 bifunctional hydroxymethylpyrimidine kinase/phosphomethylpyrimidine kinase [Kordiimonas sp. SCSIO 12603]